MLCNESTVRQASVGVEADYRFLFDHAPLPSCIYSVDSFAVLDVNQAALHQYGYAKHELVGRDVRRLLHPEEISRFDRSPCRGKEGPQDGEVWRHRTKAGHDFLTRVSTHLVRFRGLHAQMAVAHDITEHRLVARRARNAERKLKQALTQTIQVLSCAAEHRDAYTAGHQQRVAGLTVAIAYQMNLPSHQIDGLRFGALVHDVGKLGVPAEILALPRKLRTEEFSLVQVHAQIGYEIIKDVEYPWPIADMVLHHHERLDGSGYPHQLRGEEISLEVRILGLADTIEAIASHRPYRAGKGIDRAVAEVTVRSGTVFDSDVVEACRKLHIRGELAALLAIDNTEADGRRDITAQLSLAV